jgi:Protein of unknown function (DUF992)
MRSLLALGVATVFALATPASAGGVKIGVLSCDVEGGVGFIIGSSKDVECTFKGSRGLERYTGSIGKLGIDIGITDQTRLVWAVFAPGRTKKGALRGNYTGVSAEATVIVGLGANVLVGGFKDGINLQPISLQAQTGLNVAAGIASLSLR